MFIPLERVACRQNGSLYGRKCTILG